MLLTDKLFNGRRKIKISDKWMKHKFNCTVDYILENCKGRCCQGTGRIMISLLPNEQTKHENAGYIVKNGLLQANLKTGLCPHKKTNGLCNVHGTDMKPFGCIASPFTLNKNGTLIIRYRYTKMKCHGTGNPAYEAFRASLNLIFGYEEAEIICQKLKNNETKIIGIITENSYQSLKYLDELKCDLKKI